MSSVYPDEFPEQCPPVDAKPAQIAVYRFVSHDPPTEEDFWSIKKEYPTRVWRGREICRTHGLSVFEDREDALYAQELSPNLKDKILANGIIEPTTGTTLKTPSQLHPTHITWWLYKGVNPYAHFSVCRKESSSNG